ncbi:MAG: transcriptional repressor [Bacilli bacterium]|nr:transcriptional repressor [Bacilli bacterium]
MRNSKQRDVILKIVLDSSDHPTADMVYNRARKEIDNISLGTVYRNLNLLSEQGIIKKFKIVGDIERFDKTVITHSHFVCKECGKVIDIMEDSLSDFIKELSNKTNANIERYEVSLFGTCSHCQ